MEILSVPRIILAGAHAGVGKSLIGLGLAYELRKRNISLSCGLVAPDLLQAILLRRTSGRYVRVLDERLLSAGQVLTSLYHASVGSDFVLIEGSRGLFDGTAVGTLKGSDAELAGLTRTPVVLVVDVRGFGSSLAALVRGYSDFAQGVDVIGTILNRVDLGDGDEVKDREYYAAACQSFGVKPVLGGLPQLSGDFELPHSGVSQARNVTSLPRQFLVDLGQLIANHVDIPKLTGLASAVIEVRIEDFRNEPRQRRCRIAVSEDLCFNICFQDNLDLLRYFGAEIVTFSPLADTALPQRVGAVYLTGGFIRDYGQELANNESMRNSIRDFAEQGGVIYSEGAGTAYLCNEFQLEPKQSTLAGVGIIPAVAEAMSVRGGDVKLGSYSYNEAVTIDDSILGRTGLIIKGISTGEWMISGEERMVKTLRISRSGAQHFHEGYSPGAQIVSTFLFNHFGSNPLLAKNIVDAAEVVARI